jgi:hypothetical protein
MFSNGPGDRPGPALDEIHFLGFFGSRKWAEFGKPGQIRSHVQIQPPPRGSWTIFRKIRTRVWKSQELAGMFVPSFQNFRLARQEIFGETGEQQAEPGFKPGKSLKFPGQNLTRICPPRA